MKFRNPAQRCTHVAEQAPKPAQINSRQNIAPRTAKVAFALCLPLLSIGAIGCAHSQAKAERDDAARIVLEVRGYGGKVTGSAPPRERGETDAGYNARLVKAIVESFEGNQYVYNYRPYGSGGNAAASYDLDTCKGRLKALKALMQQGADISQVIQPLVKVAVYSEQETSFQAKEILFALAKNGVDVSAAVRGLVLKIDLINHGYRCANELELLKGFAQAGVDISEAVPNLKILVTDTSPEISSQAKELLVSLEKT